MQNNFNIDIYMDLPKGSNYTLTLYDEWGNQVGKAEWDEESRKTLSIPNWDTYTNKYCIKIENKMERKYLPMIITKSVSVFQRTRNMKRRTL